MKRFIIYGTLTLILVVVGGVWSVGSWLLESPQGVRWLLGELSRRTPVKIQARTVTGGIGKTLRLEGMTVSWPLGGATLEEFRLRCRPLLLPFGHLAVQELFLRGVRVRDDQPDSGKPPELTWPKLTGVPTWLDAWVDRLQVDDLEYRRLGGAPVKITSFSGAVDWRHDLLTATALELVVLQGRAAGTIAAGFGRPTLLATITATPTGPLSGFSRFDLRARLLSGSLPEQLSGPLSLTAFRGSHTGIELAGDLGVTRNSLNLRNLKITRPGERGVLQGEGRVILTATQPRGSLALRMTGLDLAPETGTPTELSGELTLEGTALHYTGRFDLNNRGESWRTARLAGSFSGDDQGMTFTGLDGLMLGGRVKGGFRMGWHEGLELAGSLSGEKLDPARVTPDWNGVVNLTLQGSARWPVAGPVRASLSGSLRESRLRGQPLKGEVVADSLGNSLRIRRLLLKGNGFDISAQGELRQRLNVAATITDLSALIPKSSGKVELKGWVRQSAEGMAGAFTGHGRELTADGVAIAAGELTARFDNRPGVPLDVTARLRGVTWNHLHAESASLLLQGRAERHTLDVALTSAGAEITAAASGGYGQGAWQGEITTLSGRDRIGSWKLAAPARLTLSPETITLSPLRFTGIGTGELELGGGIHLDPLRGDLRASWHGLELRRGEQWLTGIRLSGTSSGSLRLESLTGERVNLVTHISAAGVVAMTDRTVTVQQASLDLTADGEGVRASLNLGTAEGIGIHGRFTSPVPARLKIPQQGDLNVAWEGVDLLLLRRYLPPELRLGGTLSGKVKGRLLPQKRLELTGTASLSDGFVLWRRQGGELSAKVRKGDLAWQWQGEALTGRASLTLAEYGEATADFSLPLPARLATSLNPEGMFRGGVKGQFHENGFLTILFPGVLRESRGEIALELRAEGPWREPRMTGRLELSKAGAYLPSAGVTLKELQLVASLDRDLLRVERFSMASGGGGLSGKGEVRLEGYRVKRYGGSVKGEKFQVVRLPELQAVVAPDITFEGTPEQLEVRGVVRIPELLAKGSDRTTAVQPSSDVIVAQGEGPVVGQSRLGLDIRVKAELGEKVFVKEAGLDAKLEGEVELTLHGNEKMKGTGEIRVVKGRYSTYGVTLEIKRGRAIFAGGSVERPTLDILALREIGDVKAGVTVQGTPVVPVVRLYADPAMPDVDILSYIVLGRRLNESEEKSDLLMKAASVLASRGESVFLQEQIKSRLGIDTFEVTTAKQQVSNYTKVEPSLLGTGQKSSSTGITESVLQVGKYLTPKLYFSYGWSLFNDSHIFKVRYIITKQWEIETSTSTEATGGDIFYRIEFQ